jgi:hypothetical protein
MAFAYESCSPADPQNSNTVVEPNTPQTYRPNAQQLPEKIEFKGEKVDFKGVSFKYNPQKLGKVTAEEVPEFPLEDPDFRPDGVEPRHVKFTFYCKEEYCWEGFIAIYSFPDFPQMYAVNKYMMQSMEEEVEAMRKVVNDKDVRYGGQIPYLRWIDASQSFQTNVKLSQFDKGKGLFFVTYLNTEMALISNDHLRYIFEGLTDDGKYYVLAEIPVSVKFLPVDPPEEFEGYKEKFLYDDYPYSDAHNRRYKNYISSITTRLEKLPAHDFHPDLKYLEEMIASLKIEK